jgi:hypothetical protein
MTFTLQTRLYDLVDHDSLSLVQTWVADPNRHSQLIKARSGDSVTYAVAITDYLEPESIRTDRYAQFESQFGSGVQLRLEE